MPEIIPAILTNNPQELRDMLLKLEGKVDRVQIDIIDGKFANNRTIDPSALENIDTTLKLDYHLMTVNPVDWVERCVRGQADRIIGQIERMNDQLEFVGKVQEVGLSVGLGLDLGSDVNDIDSAILLDLDVVLVMGTKAGFGGQKFNEDCLSVISKLSEIKQQDQSPFVVCVDGGETLEVEPRVIRAGADEIVVGRSLFDGNIEDNINKFHGKQSLTQN